MIWNTFRAEEKEDCGFGNLQKNFCFFEIHLEGQRKKALPFGSTIWLKIKAQGSSVNERNCALFFYMKEDGFHTIEYENDV